MCVTPIYMAPEYWNMPEDGGEAEFTAYTRYACVCYYGHSNTYTLICICICICMHTHTHQRTRTHSFTSTYTYIHMHSAVDVWCLGCVVFYMTW
jgi:serine/threonine protein kinase